MGRRCPETVYLTRSTSQTTDDGWLVISVEVGPWQPLRVGDRIVALDRHSRDEFLVEVAGVEQPFDEVYYRLRHLADLDPAAEPRLNSTRSWLPLPWTRARDPVSAAHAHAGLWNDDARPDLPLMVRGTADVRAAVSASDPDDLGGALEPSCFIVEVEFPLEEARRYAHAAERFALVRVGFKVGHGW